MSEIKVNSIKGVGATNAAITVNNTDGTCTANLTNRQNRNLIINGAMQVAQRGTTSTVSDYGTVDRFELLYGGTDEAPTQSQVDVASGTTPYTLGFRKAFRATNGNQTSVASDDFMFMRTRFEAQDIANSGWNYTSSSSDITLSFWVKSFDTNENLGLTLFWDLFRGTDFTTSSFTNNAWAAFSSSSRSKDQTSTWYQADNATFEITGVQLEVGSVATDFEHRSFGQELALCQRYFYNYMPAGNANRNIGIGCYTGGGNQYELSIRHPVVMRDTPSYEEVGGTDFFANFGNTGGNGIVTYSGFSADQLMNISTGLFTTNAGSHGGKATRAKLNNASASMAFDAEL